MKTLLILSFFLGICLAFAAALPFFANTHRDFRGGHNADGVFVPSKYGAAPQNQAVYVSSSASDYDSTPSDGGGDTNPTAPTAGPGGNPTQGGAPGGAIVLADGVSVGGMTAAIVIGLAVVVGIAIVVAIYIIKKKG